MVKGAIDHPLYIVVSGDMAVAVNIVGADDGINYKWIAAIPGKFYFFQILALRAHESVQHQTNPLFSCKSEPRTVCFSV